MNQIQENVAAFKKFVLEHCPAAVRERLAQTLSRPREEIQAELEHEVAELSRQDQLASGDIRRRVMCGLRGDQWNNTFKSFRFAGSAEDRAIQHEALKRCLAWANAYPAVKRGIMLYGSYGVGKDHLLHSIVNRLLERKVDVRLHYVYCAGLQERMMKNEYYSEFLYSCDLLLLSDLHLAFNHSDWVGNVVRDILNSAESSGWPIICASTNYSIDDFRLAENIGGAVASRLADIFAWIELRGPDRRLGNGP